MGSDSAVTGGFTEYDVVFGRTVIPAANQNKSLKKDTKGFDYAEHCLLGDSIKLLFADDKQVAASDHKFQLTNGLNLTYGQVNSLAGDFYGTSAPISDGKNDDDRSTRFIQAYNTLAGVSSRQPREAINILAVLQTEVDAVNKALEAHLDPSAAYFKLPDVSNKLQSITLGRPNNQPSYLSLARINWDLFGRDARTAYDTGHRIALEKAITGDLDLAYTMNAFADRYLASFFSAGHLRTPRKFLHNANDIAADACAKLMYDEENAIGLSVKNPAGESWTVYGDKYALDKANKDNTKRCVAALQASSNEIYDAYKTKKAPSSPSEFKAWIHAPQLWSAGVSQKLSPLFTLDYERRESITDRKTENTTSEWTFSETAMKCKTSGWWNHPIIVDGPKPQILVDGPKPQILVWTSTATCSDKDMEVYLFYQNGDGYVHVSQRRADGTWKRGIPIFKAARSTPLAAVAWNGGVRVYYLDEQYKLQEYCTYNAGTSWSLGGLGQQVRNFQPNYFSGIAAVRWGDRNSPLRIRVYCQELGSNSIKEFCWDGSWAWPGNFSVHDALSGSSIAALVVSTWFTVHIRVYFQARDLSLREQCMDESWYRGGFNPGVAPARTPISTFAGADWPNLHVFWRNQQNNIVRIEFKGGWRPINTFMTNIKPEAQFAVIPWKGGSCIRLYYQGEKYFIREYCCDDGRHFDGATLENS